ncbi:NAD(P)-dependent oxidoreductase [Exiguobacterium sp. AM39-5BH]|uniref:NAD(P)-dependent oxidoreductase n=1 Tax=Exiguobacterium sp. AM39-5BH TaxID=2292355 RepID=UPI000FE21D6C|nr:NAD(P)-dependent oxidoreductase [Exiguobacterium sp. AM39-5BH]RHB49590.1 dihydrofolate reductase [Exiguobacterium sp. AM39-5BH]
MNLLSTGVRLTPEQLAKIERLGYTVTTLREEADVTDIDVSEVEGLICNNVFQYCHVDDFKQLRFVQAISAGIDRLPFDELQERDIRLYNAGDTYAIPMAEWVVWQLLDFMKHGASFREKQANRHWEKERRLRELTGKTVALLGLGHVGEAIAKRLRAFDMTIIGVGHREKQVPFVDRYVLTDALHDVLAESDVIVIALPLTDDTYHLIDAEAIAAMKEDAVLLNVARGSIIDETALIAALEEGKFFGVALDVFETEPLPSDHALYNFEWVTLTPHNSYVSDRVNERLFENIVRNLRHEQPH